MCGICGFSGFSDDRLLKAMTSALARRGPDEEGFHVSGGAVSLGMRRLRVIDLETGSQPVYSEDRSVCAVFNGEIYNYRELRRELESAGHRFYSRSDTETLAHGWEQWGRGLPARLRGMFAFAVWDSRSRELFLARDHFGIKPLCYAEAGGAFLFASEARPLLLSPRVGRDLDPAALAAYFTRGCVPPPLTVFSGVKKLPPASWLSWKDGRAESGSFWSPPRVSPGGPRGRELAGEAWRLLSASVEEQLVSDVPLGVLLSGGLDSSALALLAASGGRRIKTFTLAYEGADPSFDETAKAARVAALIGSEHRELRVSPDIREPLSSLAAALDEPCGDASILPTCLVTREARRHVTVALAGIGGDELFGGYPRYLGARLLPYYLSLPSPLRSALSAAAAALPEGRGSRNLAGWARRFAGSGGGFGGAYSSWGDFLAPAEKAGLFNAGLSVPAGAPGPETAGDLAAWELRNYLSPDLLFLADRASMFNSLELRVPFLDIRLAELMLAAPLSEKTAGFRLKAPLKRALEGKLPAGLIGQRKKGFQLPVSAWLAGGPLSDWAREILLSRDSGLSGFLKPCAVESLFRGHSAGRDRSDALFAMLVFELWHRSLSSVPALRPAPAAAVSPLRNGPILLVCLGGIGDAVMASAQVRALRSAYPAGKIELLALERSAEAAGLIPGLDALHLLPLGSGGEGAAGAWRALKVLLSLRRKNYGLALNLMPVSSRAGWLKMMAFRLLVRPAFFAGRSAVRLPGLYDEDYPEELEPSANWYALMGRPLASAGVAAAASGAAISVGGDASARAAEALAKAGASGMKAVALNPGAFDPARRWPEGRWRALAAALLEARPDVFVIFAGGRGDLPVCEAGSAGLTRAASFCGRLSLEEQTALFALCAAVVANNSGPMHLAAAAGARVVALMGPGEAGIYAPPGRVKALEGSSGLSDISVAEVLAAVTEALR